MRDVGETKCGRYGVVVKGRFFYNDYVEDIFTFDTARFLRLNERTLVTLDDENDDPGRLLDYGRL